MQKLYEAQFRTGGVEIRLRCPMLYWAIAFFVIAIAAGLLGMMGVAGGASAIAQGLSVILLLLFGVSSITYRRRGPVA